MWKQTGAKVSIPPHVCDRFSILCATAELTQALIKPTGAGIDSAGSASAVVLRDIHCALLRVIQNQGVEKEKKEGSQGQPMTAKLFSPDSGGSVPWTAHVAQLILAAPPTKAAATAKVCLHATSHTLMCTVYKTS